MGFSRPVYGFYVVKPGDSVARLLQDFYAFSGSEAARMLPAIAMANPHIKDLNRIRPGQFLDLSLQSTDPFAAPQRANDLNEMERVWSGMRSEQQLLIEEKPGVLETVGPIIGNTALNYADSTFNAIKHLMEDLTAVTSKYGRDLVQNYAMKDRRHKWQSELYNKVAGAIPVRQAYERIPRFLNNTANRFTESYFNPLLFKHKPLRNEIYKLVRLAPEKIAGYQPFSKALDAMGKVAKAAQLGGTATTWIIPGIFAIKDSVSAWNTPAFGRTTTAGVGNVLGGVAGAPLAYLACSIALGPETLGTSLLFCAGVVGVPAGMATSGAGEWAGGTLYDTVQRRDEFYLRALQGAMAF